jgi:hypothetical protein
VLPFSFLFFFFLFLSFCQIHIGNAGQEFQFLFMVNKHVGLIVTSVYNSTCYHSVPLFLDLIFAETYCLYKLLAQCVKILNCIYVVGN